MSNDGDLTMFRTLWIGLCCVALTLVSSTVPSQASFYDFEALTSGSNLIGQDNWIHANTLATSGNEMVVLAGAGSNTSKVATPFTGNAQLYRQNNGSFSIPTFTGTELVYLEGDFQLGSQLNVFGLLQAPGAASYSATSPWIGFSTTTTGTPPVVNRFFSFRPSFVPGGGATVSVNVADVAPEIVLGDWVRLRMELNLAANGGNGEADVFYKDLTLGQTSFTPVPGMQNLNGGILANSAANKYFWDSMFLRGGITSGNNSIDNLEVGIIPEPGSVILAMIGLIGLVCGWRKRA
jgi:PEP-CTERM motif